MVDVSNDLGPIEQRDLFFSRLLEEAQGIMQSTGNDAPSIGPMDTSNDSFGGQSLVPDMAMLSQNFDPYAYGGDTSDQQNVPEFDPQLNKNPQGQAEPAPEQKPEPMPEQKPEPNPVPVPEQKPEPNPEKKPEQKPPVDPKPDSPGDRETKWGNRNFKVHPDGSAEYTVVSGDCVWYVATDVLKARTGKAPNDAEIIVEVNAIAAASGLTKNGRNPDLIYPGDKLVIPPAKKVEPKK